MCGGGGVRIPFSGARSRVKVLKIAPQIVANFSLKIYIYHLETEPSLRHFTDQTAEATISKLGSGVLYSIRLKMWIIKSVWMKAFIKKKIKKKIFPL